MKHLSQGTASRLAYPYYNNHITRRTIRHNDVVTVDDSKMIIDYITARVFKNSFNYNEPTLDYYSEKGNHECGKITVQHNSYAERFAAPTVLSAVAWIRDKYGLGVKVKRLECSVEITASYKGCSEVIHTNCIKSESRALLYGLRFGIERFL